MQCPTFGEFEISSIGLGFIYVHENFNSFIVESVGMEKCEVVVSSPSSNSTLGGCGILQTHTFFEVFEQSSSSLAFCLNTFEHSPCNYCQLIWLHRVWNFSVCLFAQASNKRVQTKLLPNCTKAFIWHYFQYFKSIDSIPFVTWNEAGLLDLGGPESGTLLCVHVSIIIYTVCKSH